METSSFARAKGCTRTAADAGGGEQERYPQGMGRIPPPAAGSSTKPSQICLCVFNDEKRSISLKASSPTSRATSSVPLQFQAKEDKCLFSAQFHGW